MNGRSAVLAACIAAGLAEPACAQLQAPGDSTGPLDRISVWLGGYRAGYDGDLRVHTADQRLDTGVLPFFTGRDTVQRARLDWLPFASQGLLVDFYRLQRSQTRSAGGALSIDGVRYEADAQLDLRSRVDFGNVAYRWWFGSGDAVFGAGLGAGYYRLSLQLDARARAGDSSTSGSASYDDHAWAPLGTLGLRYRVSEGLRLYADLAGVGFGNRNSRTTLANGAAGLEWFPWKNVGIGVEYAATRVHYRRDDTDGDQGQIRLDLKGPALYLRLRY